MTWTKTTVFLWPLLCLAACGTDPGDVGSGSEGSESGDATSPSGTATSITGATQTDGGTSAESGSGSVTVSEGSSAGSSSDATDSDTDTEATTEATTEGSSSDDTGESTGTPVADCSECGPDQGCVAEIAFGTEYFCVPWPDDCGVEFDCACAGEFCADPFTACFDLPDPPQRGIVCECPTC